jgi:RNA polymerase sigma-70 factor (ECF subfamily)
MTQPNDQTEIFQELLEPVLGPAFGLALTMTADPVDAEDLVQEAALLAFRGFHTFQQGTNFRAWFMRILTNAHLGNKRKEKRRPNPVELDDVPDHYLFERSTETGLGSQSEDPVEGLLRRLDVDQVNRAIQDLPDEFRSVAALYFMEDLSYPEIAEMMDIPVGTVRSRLHRARKVLQRDLWELAEEEGIVPRDAAEAE